MWFVCLFSVIFSLWFVSHLYLLLISLCRLYYRVFFFWHIIFLLECAENQWLSLIDLFTTLVGTKKPGHWSIFLCTPRTLIFPHHSFDTSNSALYYELLFWNLRALSILRTNNRANISLITLWNFNKLLHEQFCLNGRRAISGMLITIIVREYLLEIFTSRKVSMESTKKQKTKITSYQS